MNNIADHVSSADRCRTEKWKVAGSKYKWWCGGGAAAAAAAGGCGCGCGSRRW